MAYTFKKGDVVVNGSGTYAKIVKTIGEINVCIGWANSINDLEKMGDLKIAPSVRFNAYSAKVNKIVPVNKKASDKDETTDQTKDEDEVETNEDVEDTTDTDEEVEDLSDFNVKQLRGIAEAKGIDHKGLKRAGLIKALETAK